MVNKQKKQNSKQPGMQSFPFENFLPCLLVVCIVDVDNISHVLRLQILLLPSPTCHINKTDLVNSKRLLTHMWAPPEMQRVLVSSSPSRVRVRMSRVRVQMRRTRVRVQQVSSPSPGFCVSSPNPSPEEKN